MESNFGPSILGTLDTISISNRPTVLLGGILPAWKEGEEDKRGDKRRKREREVGWRKRGVKWREAHVYVLGGEEIKKRNQRSRRGKGGRR